MGFLDSTLNEIYTESVELRALSSPPLWIRCGWTLSDAMRVVGRFVRREPPPLNEAGLEALEQQIAEATAAMKQQTTKAARIQHYRDIKALKLKLSLAAQVVYDCEL